MLAQRLQPPLRVASTSIGRSAIFSSPSACLYEAFAQLNICNNPRAPIQVRHASHAQQGAVNGVKNGAGRRLGAKKTGEQYVIPGNIIFRQRGTLWFPGENCAMGRDHTIYATEPGFVKYYKDPERHSKRQYIGVVYKRDQVLPLPRNSVRRRRLGMHSQKIVEEENTLPKLSAEFAELAESEELGLDGQVQAPQKTAHVETKSGTRVLTLRPGYMYREGNWEIGQAAERAGVSVRPFERGNRWLAWRKAKARKEAAIQKRRLGGRQKQKPRKK